MTMHAPTLDRFESKYVVDALSGCWLWSAGLNTYGYAQFSADGEVYGHRWSYKRFVGPIPDGLQVDHLCRTRSCVNPAHLEVVTVKENVRRGDCFNHSGLCPSCGSPYDRHYTKPSGGIHRSCSGCRNARRRKPTQVQPERITK